MLTRADMEKAFEDGQLWKKMIGTVRKEFKRIPVEDIEDLASGVIIEQFRRIKLENINVSVEAMMIERLKLRAKDWLKLRAKDRAAARALSDFKPSKAFPNARRIDYKVDLERALGNNKNDEVVEVLWNNNLISDLHDPWTTDEERASYERLRYSVGKVKQRLRRMGYGR